MSFLQFRFDTNGDGVELEPLTGPASRRIGILDAGIGRNSRRLRQTMGNPPHKPGETKIESSRVGRLAPLLLEDFIAGRLEGEKDGNRFFQPCVKLRDSFWAPDPHQVPGHELVMTGTQCYNKQNDPSGNGETVVSCLCSHCRHHFVFRVCGGGSCGSPGDDTNIYHHYTLDEVQTLPERWDQENWKLYPLVSSVRCKCSTCEQNVVIETSLPRIKAKWIRMVTDTGRVRRQYELARERSPDRYDKFDVEKVAATAIISLSQYTSNMLKDGPDAPARQINVRNKKFAVQFGTSLNDMFEHLGFRQEEDPSDGELKWFIPPLSTSTGVKTPLRSMRAFIEDIGSEIRSWMAADPKKVHLIKPEKYGLQLVQNALKCDHRAHRNWKFASDPACCRLLGAPEDSDPVLLRHAYSMQAAQDAAHKEVYLQALKEVAVGSGDVDLQIFCVKQESILMSDNVAGDAESGQQTAVKSAYQYFGLYLGASDENILGAYRNMREQSPAQHARHRLELIKLARHTDSQAIWKEVREGAIDFKEACDLLEVDPDWPKDSIIQVAQVAGNSGDHDNTLILHALRALSQHFGGDVALDSLIDELSRDITLLNGYGTSQQDASLDETGSMDRSMPVGLENLRNTCYLNSILQYFYSVDAVRNLVLIADLPDLGHTQESVEKFLADANISPSTLEPGRAYVGTEFLRELRTLYEDFLTTNQRFIKPKQRLANAALLIPERARASAAATNAPGKDGNAVPKEAPPLPPRDNAGGKYAKMQPTVTIDAVPENEEIASNFSSQTLINQPDEDSATYVVVENDEAKPSPVATHDIMLTDEDAPGDVDEDVEMPEAPPPYSEFDEAAAKPEKVSGTGTRAEARPADSTRLTIEELAAELDAPIVGSEQMDVDEVMGNCIDHLEAAATLASAGTARARDKNPIKAAFFATFADYRKQLQDLGWNRKERLDRWVTAYPAPADLGRRTDLYEALQASFDRELIDPKKRVVAFTALMMPPPHFHVYIQRSYGSGKNSNPIEFPRTLYLDRYLDEGEDSDLYMRRKRSWDIKNRLATLDKALTCDDDVDTYMRNWIPHATLISSEGPDILESEPIEDALGRYPDFEAGKDADEVEALAECPERWTVESHRPVREETMAFLQAHRQRILDERTQLEQERASLFIDEGFQNVKYQLHAVICHGGSSAKAGHYWAWIYDFEQTVWRKYNDTAVTKHCEEDFEKAARGSEPYYVAYVRDQGEDDLRTLVSIPGRE